MASFLSKDGFNTAAELLYKNIMDSSVTVINKEIGNLQALTDEEILTLVDDIVTSSNAPQMVDDKLKNYYQKSETDNTFVKAADVATITTDEIKTLVSDAFSEVFGS